MPTVFPELSESQLGELPSRAEARLYAALRDQLPSAFVVFFQVGWILRAERGEARDGEADFLVAHPDLGWLCIEVKGGGISFDANTGSWHSVDRHGVRHAIKNPVDQALRAKYSIRAKLSENKQWADLGLSKALRGHAVFFPDVGDIRSFVRPDLPRALVGSAGDLGACRHWIEGAFDCWRNGADGGVPLGGRGIQIMRDAFARSFSVPPLLAVRLADQESRRLTLTNEQIRVLDLLRSHRRAAVTGGAGTGKTVLAAEKAKRLARDGFRTLLTCYNRQLADFLATACSGIPNLEVMSFHQLCHRQVERARVATGRDLLGEAKLTYPGKDVFDVQLPNALGYSVEVLDDRYDAIVCDEGQDFRDDYWVALEFLLSEYDESPLYVFYDDNQDLYSRAGTFPIKAAPFSLSVNCRNTVPIHRAAYGYYKGEHVAPPELEGDEIEFESAPSIEAQAAKIGAKIVNLISRHSVAPEDITVLVADAYRKADFYRNLQRLPLPRPATWLEEGGRRPGAVLMDTVQRFKGLESSVVFLWGLDAVAVRERQELLYVGMSRAKSVLTVVGTEASCKLISQAAAAN